MAATMSCRKIHWMGHWGVAVVMCLLLYAYVIYFCNTNKDQHDRKLQLDNEKENVLDNERENVLDNVVEGVRPECLETRDSQGNENLRNLRKSAYACDLAKVDLDKLPERNVFLTFHSYLDNIDVICKRKLRAGKLGDGGWEVCDDVDVRPEPPCIVYSFGINYDFSFDDGVSDLYGCHVYSFDPSMGSKPHNRSDKVHFYDLGLYGKTGHTMERFPNWQMYTLKDLRALLGHSNVPIDILKIDIEHSEWSALPDMLATGQLEDVKQFYLEYHAIFSLRRHVVLPQLKLFQGLEKLGFKKFYVHKNVKTPRKIAGFPVVRTKCYEVHYIKRE